MGLLSFLGFGSNKLKDALKNGAVIIDVRTAHEYDRGRIKGSINIPLERMRASVERIRAMKKPVILCASDGRSDEAKSILRSAGITEVYTSDWERLMQLIQQR